MTSYWSTLTNLSERDSSIHVELADDARYVVKGIGSTSFQLDSSDNLHMSDILFVLGLKKTSYLSLPWRTKASELPLWMGRSLCGLRT